jgi:hypothetical protein
MPKTRPPSPRCTEKERFYRSLFEEADARGLSRAELAVQADVSPGTLSWWRSEIRRREALRRGQRVTRKNSRAEEAVEFVSIGVAGEEDPDPALAPTADRWTFEIALPGGATVRVPGAFEETALTRVVRAVSAAC